MQSLHLETAITSLGDCSHFNWRLQSLHLEIGITTFGDCNHFTWGLQSLHLEIAITSLGEFNHFTWRLKSLHLEIAISSLGDYYHFTWRLHSLHLEIATALNWFPHIALSFFIRKSACKAPNKSWDLVNFCPACQQPLLHTHRGHITAGYWLWRKKQPAL